MTGTVLVPSAPCPLTAAEFDRIAKLLHEWTGIRLTAGKEALVIGRLDRRLQEIGAATYSDYVELITQPEHADEACIAVDLLTTNETFFFREPAHFEFLAELAARVKRRTFRVWSAASSSGEEAYSAAMVLSDVLPDGSWEIVGTDISSRVVAHAQRGVFPIAAAERIPPAALKRYCRRGRDEYDGLMIVAPALRSKVKFLKANLLDDLGHLGVFDVILLRNVMIYFGPDTRSALVGRVERMLRPGGHLLVSHSETLNDLPTALRALRPSVYTSPGDDDV